MSTQTAFTLIFWAFFVGLIVGHQGWLAPEAPAATLKQEKPDVEG